MVKSEKVFHYKGSGEKFDEKSINVDFMGKFKSFETVIVALLFILQNNSLNILSLKT